MNVYQNKGKIIMRNEKNEFIVKFVKDRLPLIYWTIILLICFTLFIFAPYEIFFTNIGDMQFPISDLIPFTMLLFLATGLGMFIAFKVLHFLSSKIADFFLVLLFALLLVFYIQGNFLPTDYGLLNGEQVDWNTMESYPQYCGLVYRLFYCLFCI